MHSFLSGKTILVLLILAGISSNNNVSILDKSDEAIQAYDKATEINPHNLMALTNKGLILTFLGKYNEAIQHVTKQLKLTRRI